MLKRLIWKKREIIALKQTNSYDEIAEDLDIKTGTLRQMFSKVKEKFMRCMGFLMNENDKILIHAYLDGETSNEDSNYV